MSGAGGKGKQISVIVAGATGNVGSELVSRLVSHPDVSRVVALTRHTIPVNRWSSVFPHLHTGDALRYLSVVPVDWEKLIADLANIPMSYVKDGRWRQRDVEAERERFRWREQRREAAGGKRTDLAGGIPTGYVRYEPRTAAALHDAAAAHAHNSDGKSAGAAVEQLHSSQEFLRLLLQQSFYNSVFSGHHVAINCLGTTHLVSSSKVVQVDYELSLAFAKVVRLFNCMTHAEPSEDEERLLVESTSRELNSVLWEEIYTACYGKGGDKDVAAADLKAANAHSEDHHHHDLARKGKEAVHFMSRGGVATLRNFTQMSVRAASPYSPVPYLRAHGRRDRDLLLMFNRVDTTAARHHGWGPQQTVTRTSKDSIMVGAPSVVELQRGLLARLARLWRWRSRAAAPAASTTSAGSSGSSSGSSSALEKEKAGGDKVEDEMEVVARHRAELFLRRDVVKIFESANITIWRPGVLTRAKPRFFDYVFSLFERPVDAERLAECITDDIIEDFYVPGRRKPNQVVTGSVKIINGKSVARRVMMKKLEDGLNRQDSTRRRL